MFTYHYGYWRKFNRSRWVAIAAVCDSKPNTPGNRITVNRGSVSCPECLKMMGPS